MTLSLCLSKYSKFFGYQTLVSRQNNSFSLFELLTSTLRNHMITAAPVRNMAKRSEICAKPTEEPRCSPAMLLKTKCAMAKQMRKNKKKEKKKKLKTMWENPACCLPPCPKVLPRFDELYYQETDKTTREYHRTWSECPEYKAPKKGCEYEKISLPPVMRRKKTPKTARKPEQCRLTVRYHPKCLKINLPGCKNPKNPQDCRTEKPQTLCKKICAPFPSYSECKQTKATPQPFAECDCHEHLPLCKAWELYGKRLKKRRTTP